MSNQTKLSYESIGRIAERAHEANRSYCASINDFSLLPWNETSFGIQTSARVGVRHVIENPDTTPEELHQSWSEHKKAEGWVYGTVKCEAKREHPCLVDYALLPEAQRVKDTIFSAVVKSGIYMEAKNGN